MEMYVLLTFSTLSSNLIINRLNLFSILFFCIWSVVASILPLHAYEANGPFWSRVRLHGSFFVKQDTYKVGISGMQPSGKSNELQFNTPINPDNNKTLYCIRWYHAPSIYFNTNESLKEVSDNLFDDKQILYFTGKGISISTQLFLSTDFRQLRIGVGAGIKYSFLKNMTGELYGDTLINSNSQDKIDINKSLMYTPPKSYYFSCSPLFLLGYKICESNTYALLLDSTLAPCMFRHTEFGTIYNWMYFFNFDIGATWEKQISRYVNWSIRVAYGHCMSNQILDIEIIDEQEEAIMFNPPIVSHKISGFLLQIGMSIRLPALSRCPIPECSTRLDHKHDGKAYRGDSFFTSYPG
ncbi:hypothetical protein [Cardinium endosymbiont of Culicoides punctatus]|uniref:hypothetical protein n=1 Tax=Cardinium endosymbiont of Culicoides punctatus TaxID=2304601 RepID=UPI001058AAFD|nr:hypothetical protein [Cardinium endosymbiont of Culicoides punctatus]TDG93261.1 hypothetical protein CCPUN_09160 [Cardinium endosymbiont of Culicoides punctatus]